MQPTKEQWDDIAKQLDRQYDTVYLRCDGYLFQASLERSKNKLIIGVYVNGYIRGEWTDGEAEESKRFWRSSTRAKYKQSFVKQMEKTGGKRWCKKEGIYDKYTVYLPYWNRPLPLIRHLIKHNDSIDVLDRDTYKAELEKVMEKDGE